MNMQLLVRRKFWKSKQCKAWLHQGWWPMNGCECYVTFSGSKFDETGGNLFRFQLLCLCAIPDFLLFARRRPVEGFLWCHRGKSRCDPALWSGHVGEQPSEAALNTQKTWHVSPQVFELVWSYMLVKLNMKLRQGQYVYFFVFFFISHAQTFTKLERRHHFTSLQPPTISHRQQVLSARQRVNEGQLF